MIKLYKIFIFILINFMVIEGVFGQVQLSPAGTDSDSRAYIPNLNVYSNDEICGTATSSSYSFTVIWNTAKFAERYVKEAKRRGLNCGVGDNETKKASNKTKSTNLYNKALNYASQLDLSEAEKSFKNFISNYPKHEKYKDAQYWLGRIYFHQKKYEEAVITLAEFNSLYPNDSRFQETTLLVVEAATHFASKEDVCEIANQALDFMINPKKEIEEKINLILTSNGCKVSTNKKSASKNISKIKKIPAELKENKVSLSAKEIALLTAKISSCWKHPPSIDKIKQDFIPLSIRSNIDGSIKSVQILDKRNYQSSTEYRAVADSARRAILNCGNLPLPPKKYSVWKQLILDFDIPKVKSVQNNYNYKENKNVKGVLGYVSSENSNISAINAFDEEICYGYGLHAGAYIGEATRRGLDCSKVEFSSNKGFHYGKVFCSILSDKKTEAQDLIEFYSNTFPQDIILKDLKNIMNQNFENITNLDIKNPEWKEIFFDTIRKPIPDKISREVYNKFKFTLNGIKKNQIKNLNLNDLNDYQKLIYYFYSMEDKKACSLVSNYFNNKANIKTVASSKNNIITPTIPKSDFETERRKRKELERKLAALDTKQKQEQQRIATDNRVPLLEIISNKTEGKRGTITGIARDNVQVAEVTVDGQIVKLNSNGKFKYSTFVPSDGITLNVQVTDVAGLTSSKTVSLQRNDSNVSTSISFDRLNPLGKRVKGNSNALALIVGVEGYKNTNADAIYADKDAKMFRDYASEKLGIPENRIKTLLNDKAEYAEILLTTKDWLRRASKTNKSDIYIFFAGHGLASDDGKNMYLLPYDGRPRLLDKTALLRDELFKEIQQSNPRSVTVFLDTCYSGTTRGTDMLVASRPIMIKAKEQSIPDNFTVFSAAAGDQTSKPLEEAKHGMFSYFLMKGMEGDADSNNDNKITARELHAYVEQNVVQQSSGSQTPELQGDKDRVLVQFN